MTGSTVAVVIEATGEVRDADGNLIDTPTITQTIDLPIEHARALGLDVPDGETPDGPTPEGLTP